MKFSHRTTTGWKSYAAAPYMVYGMASYQSKSANIVPYIPTGLKLQLCENHLFTSRIKRGILNRTV